jgi:hypothetical protein
MPKLTLLPVLLAVVALMTGCSHPLEIVGEGDIMSASGDRNCLLEDFQAGEDVCAVNLVFGDYQETYYAQPRPGWQFDRWENYCSDKTDPSCNFNAPAHLVNQARGKVAAPLRAIFIEDDSAANRCTKSFSASDVLVLDLSRDSEKRGACGLFSNQETIAQCIALEIAAEFKDTPECLSAFDIFVPGTAAENGDYRQFTSLVSPNSGRTYLSLQYSYESTLLDDNIQYDKGVADAGVALDYLLYALDRYFKQPDIRVFGHSKGSDAVARASRLSKHNPVQFFAFAQPGRTPSNIRGSAGYIEKLDDNLVVLTWHNDEVKFFSGGSSGTQVPEIWGFPGYVNQAGGGQSVWPLRIDHHNTYGGNYSKKDFPYCATGNKTALLIAQECKSQDGVRYLPYFWGNPQCTNTAFDMMNNGRVGDRYYIGYSGPRSSACKDGGLIVNASYSLLYSLNIADQDDCEYTMELSFDGLNFGTNRPDGGSITVSSRRDTYGRTKTGSVRLPLHMALKWKASMRDVSGRFSKCINYLDAKSEGYIHRLVVNFTHPGTGRSVTRTLIGNAEGIEYLWPLKLADKNNVAWRKTSGSWDLHSGIPPAYPADALMVKGDTEDNINGQFYKWVHLVD